MTSPHESQPLILTVDLGTSACKAAVFTGEGRLIGFDRRPTPTIQNENGYIETDPEAWWIATIEAIQNAVDDSGAAPDMISSIGVCGFMHTPIGIDEGGLVVTPTVFWNDLRSTP